MTTTTTELAKILADQHVRAKLQAQPHPYHKRPSGWRGASQVTLYTYAARVLASGGHLADVHVAMSAKR